MRKLACVYVKTIIKAQINCPVDLAARLPFVLAT